MTRLATKAEQARLRELWQECVRVEERLARDGRVAEHDGMEDLRLLAEIDRVWAGEAIHPATLMEAMAWLARHNALPSS